MVNRKLRIMQLSTTDNIGGAARVAWNLFDTYKKRGFESSMVVGHKFSDDAAVLPIPVSKTPGMLEVKHQKRLMGREHFHFPASRRILKLSSQLPDIIHAHNLHGNYFDLRSLPWLSRQLPLILMLHDTWLLGGHCCYFLDCERWKRGCGDCPHLDIHHILTKDDTAYNWRLKQRIYSKTRAYLTTPSKWLMDQVEQSMLAPAIIEKRVIYNGVDLATFHPADKKRVRDELGIPQNARMLLFSANGIKNNMWKDFKTLRQAVALVADRVKGQDIQFWALGEDAPTEKVGNALMHFVPHQKDPAFVARYYQAADIYLHAARADTFPNVILEALACGTPVAATAVGGIPEQIKGLKIGGSQWGGYDKDQATGVLTSPGDPEAMSRAIEMLITDNSLLAQLAENAAEDACQRFDLKRQADDYLSWYQEILKDRPPTAL